MALLFDLENTFFDGTFWHRQLHQMVLRWGKPIGFGEFKRAWQCDWLPQVYSGQVEYWQALSSLLAQLGVSGCAKFELLAAAKARLQSAQAGLRPYAGVAESLRELQQSGYKLGILANSILLPQEVLALLSRIGIQVSWDYCQTSRAAGQSLPTPFAFHAAARALGTSPAKVTYLSRSPERASVALESGLGTGLLTELDWAGSQPIESLEETNLKGNLRQLTKRFASRRAA